VSSDTIKEAMSSKNDVSIANLFIHFVVA